MDSVGTKDDESQGTNSSLEGSQTNSQDEEVEYCDNIASSTSDDTFPPFSSLVENVYLGNKKKRVNKEIRRMSCDCTYYPDEHDFIGCGEDCLNRLLMIECNNRCPCGEFCSNRKFQQGQKYRVDVFKTLRKGWGLRAMEDIPANQFVLEYCGEVMGYEEFEKRVETYDKENRKHYYFMTLRADEIIDATHKGNISRFINHSCSPNCETQKWTVNGYLRIGFFSIKDIPTGTEITFDYKFQRYGKKAQNCYCDSKNCRGIIGGEKHTPLKCIISGRAASPVPTSSPRRNRRRRLAEQFDDKPLEFEIAQLLGNAKGIRGEEQALKLSQFMVRAETTPQRMLLLDTLTATEDQNCLRSFVRYQGLSLLWSWMVDLGENSQHIQKKIVQVLQRLPVSNLNQIKDTKVLKVVRKWARKPSVTCVPEEETSSSDMDSRGRSPLELSDDVSKRDGNISSTSTDTVTVEDDFQYKSECKDIEARISGDSVNRTETNTLNVDKGMPLVGDKESERLETSSEPEKQDVIMMRNESVFEGCDLRTAAARLTEGRSPKLLGDSSEEEESRWSEDSASSDHEALTNLAADLLSSWSNLKEVYRIPKKSTIVEKREPESTSGAVEAVATQPTVVRIVPKIPVIPVIDGDLFQKDEFISKLGERELVERKPFQQESMTPPPSSELPSLMCGALGSDPGEAGNDASKLPIHQRLQMVASNGTPQKQHPVWYGKGNRRARKHPYNTAPGAFQPRHQAPGKARFNQPSVRPQNQAMDPGASGQPRLSPPNNQWPVQCSSLYPGTYHYQQPGGGCAQAAAGYSTQTPVQVTTQPSLMDASYYAAPAQQDVQAAAQTQYQTPYAAQGNYGLVQTSAPTTPSEQTTYGTAAMNQMSYGVAVQANPHGFQQVQQPVTQAHFSLPAFDPSKPPPNFVPSQSNVHSQQYSSVAQPHFQTASSQFPNAPPLPYSATPPSYSLQPPHTQQVAAQPVSQATTPPPTVEPAQETQRLSNAVSTTSMVSSTVDETKTETPVEVGRSKAPTDWSAKSLSKPRDVSLPSDWKLAYDGEGRAYYYHVLTRQTQWDPPSADRSPPTPELGYHGDELDSSMEMTTTFPMQFTNDVVMEVVDAAKRKKPKTPSTPPGSPPKSPVEKYTTAAADTTDVRKGLYSPSLLLQGRHLTPEQRKRRETFRMKLSAVVVNYLNPYHKIDCKVGRITTVDDFKFLARKRMDEELDRRLKTMLQNRKRCLHNLLWLLTSIMVCEFNELTHGVMVKELFRLKDESGLACNDSVKIKTKEYIRQYMHKFGPVYKAP